MALRLVWPALLLGRVAAYFVSSVVPDTKKVITLALSSADASPLNGFILFPGTICSGLAWDEPKGERLWSRCEDHFSLSQFLKGDHDFRFFG
jgi:hypothetical protein